MELLMLAWGEVWEGMSSTVAGEVLRWAESLSLLGMLLENDLLFTQSQNMNTEE